MSGALTCGPSRDVLAAEHHHHHLSSAYVVAVAAAAGSNECREDGGGLKGSHIVSWNVICQPMGSMLPMYFQETPPMKWEAFEKLLIPKNNPQEAGRGESYSAESLPLSTFSYLSHYLLSMGWQEEAGNLVYAINVDSCSSGDCSVSVIAGQS
eukprot:scaffold225707_cov15-Tisochrysis_lutea.AAC.1